MFLTATNVPQSFSDFVFECDSAIVLLKEHSEFCGHETIPVDPQYEEGEESDDSAIDEMDDTSFINN